MGRRRATRMRSLSRRWGDLMGLVLAAALAITALPSTVASTPTQGVRYYCGNTFMLALLVGEQIVPSSRDGTLIWSMKAGDFVIREAPLRIHPGARPVQDYAGFKVYTITERGRTLGYVLSDNNKALKTIVISRAFSGNSQDHDVLSRLNFHPNRPPECRTGGR